MSVTQLVDRFRQIALAQYQAELMSDSAKYNHLFDEMEDVKKALKARSGDQRRALVSLYSHGNAQVLRGRSCDSGSGA
jgi:hypothetical protein